MDTESTGFPHELLSQPGPVRRAYFRAYTMAHPRLLAAREDILNAIHEVAPNSLILLMGPTGVGKTTLRAKVEQILTTEMLPELRADPVRLPVVSVECIAPESGTFSWRDHFRRLLLQMDEPLVDYKVNPETPVRMGERATKFLPGARAAGSQYHHAVEQVLHFRRPVAVLLDEAQHLARMSSGRRLSDQLDVIKSLANCTRTVHVLLGTYELLAFRNLSAQLSRRSIDIHFPRYRVDDSNDRKIFLAVLRSFEQQIPLPEPPRLVEEWEYLYERSIGCVGVLKDWLVRALTGVFRRNANALTLRDKMLSEALEGEVSIREDAEGSKRLRTRLGLDCRETSRAGSSTGAAKQVTIETTSRQKRLRRPGQRHPHRDPIGLQATHYAKAINV